MFTVTFPGTRLLFCVRFRTVKFESGSMVELSIAFENVREIELVPRTEIRSRIVSGDTMPAEFVTRIEERGGEVHVVHTGHYTPSMWVPPGIGPALIEAETRKQYGEIRAEIVRRAGAKGGRAGGG